MKLIYWPVEESADAEIYNINTLDGLWQFVRDHQRAVEDEESFILELSANGGNNGPDEEVPYLVLAWVEVEEGA